MKIVRVNFLKFAPKVIINAWEIRTEQDAIKSDVVKNAILEELDIYLNDAGQLLDRIRITQNYPVSFIS